MLQNTLPLLNSIRICLDTSLLPTLSCISIIFLHAFSLKNIKKIFLAVRIYDCSCTELGMLFWKTVVWLFCDPMDCSPPAPLSMGFPRQEYGSGLPFPPPGDLLNPGIELVWVSWVGRQILYPWPPGEAFIPEPPGKPFFNY